MTYKYTPEKIKRNIYIVGGWTGYANWMESNMVNNMEDADLVLFTGGEDVSPSLYGETPHYTTQFNTHRDGIEVPMFEKAVRLNKHIIGICRGAQLSCAMAGGKLVQHQENNSFYHGIDTFDKQHITVSSTHHQAQYPWAMNKNKYKVIGWSVGQSSFHLGKNDDEELVINKVADNKEVEICYYPKIKALGIQSHPEMLFRQRHTYKTFSDSISYCRDLLDKHMADNIK